MEISSSSWTTTNHVFSNTGSYQQTGLISKMISSILKCISSVSDDIKIIIWQLGCFALAPGSNTYISTYIYIYIHIYIHIYIYIYLDKYKYIHMYICVAPWGKGEATKLPNYYFYVIRCTAYTFK